MPDACTGAARVALALLALAGLAACAPTYHRAPVYRYDGAAARSITEQAWEQCREEGLPAGTPSEPFRTDGCSMWPDAWITGTDWQSCCVAHDIAYWCGGPPALRWAADRELQRCVARELSPAMGAVMLPGVRAGGHPWLPLYWRWGYGHRYPAPYYDLQGQEVVPAD